VVINISYVFYVPIWLIFNFIPGTFPVPVGRLSSPDILIVLLVALTALKCIIDEC
jgi:hypothetical protein